MSIPGYKTQTFELPKGRRIELTEAWVGLVKRGARDRAGWAVNDAAHFFGVREVDVRSIVLFDDTLDGLKCAGMTDGLGNVWIAARLDPEQAYKVGLHEGYHRCMRLMGSDPFTGSEEHEADFFVSRWNELSHAVTQQYDARTGLTSWRVDDAMVNAALGVAPAAPRPAPAGRPAAAQAPRRAARILEPLAELPVFVRTPTSDMPATGSYVIPRVAGTIQQ